MLAFVSRISVDTLLVGNMGYRMYVASGATDQSRAEVEWPTLLLIILCWLAYGLLTWSWQWLGWWIVAPAGAYLLCFYGSLQHEAVHGHPTRSALFNEALVHLPIGLVFPYRRYKCSHLTHHNNDHLTDPVRDPESFYLDPQACKRMGSAGRLLALMSLPICKARSVCSVAFCRRESASRMQVSRSRGPSTMLK